MFEKFFKKPEVIVAERPEYHPSITKIHEDFETASEKLYKEAVEIINNTKITDEQKFLRLKKVGFGSTKQVSEMTKIVQEREKNLLIMKTIKYYHDKYPLYKFITENKVRQLCEKYGLIKGPIGIYTGFVPERNLKDIEKFSISNDDKRPKVVVSRDTTTNTVFYDDGGRSWRLKYAKEEIHPSLMICAPPRDFDTRDYEIKDRYMLVTKSIPDPVVLQPVKEGYLIVTAWGDEASDPIVINNINN